MTLVKFCSVKFEIPACESHFAEVLYAVTNLVKKAVDFRTTHFASQKRS